MKQKNKTMFSKIKSFLLIVLGVVVIAGCEKDLELTPEDHRQGADEVLQDEQGYKEFLAKLYAGLAVSGQEGPAGNPDLVGLDEGFSQYLRLYWMLQEISTDEAILGWNDEGVPSLNYQNWTSGNPFIRTMYSRIMYQVAQANEFIRQSSDGNMETYGVPASDQEAIREFRAEARFLRALSYYHALDLYGNPPFITEEDETGAFLPEQIQSADLFAYIESELLAIESELPDPQQTEYGRADKAAVWTLLAKLYLNAEQYTGTSRYEQVITYTDRVISAGYSLVDDYQKLFLADNDINGAQQEIIFPIRFDGIHTNSYGGMTFIIHAMIGGNMDPADFGVNSGWGGMRTTPEFVNLFPGAGDSDDLREMFHTDGQSLEIPQIENFANGYAVRKFKNVTVDGEQGSDRTGEHVDTDFPMFRLADVYLMYAEAVLRGGGGDQSRALQYVNELRARAYQSGGMVNSSELDLDFILDERGRELYWEGHRRTDLIRYNQYTQNGVWAWKNNTPQGSPTPAYRNLYPLPASDLGVNTNLNQNDGY